MAAPFPVIVPSFIDEVTASLDNAVACFEHPYAASIPFFATQSLHILQSLSNPRPAMPYMVADTLLHSRQTCLMLGCLVLRKEIRSHRICCTNVGIVIFSSKTFFSGVLVCGS